MQQPKTFAKPPPRKSEAFLRTPLHEAPRRLRSEFANGEAVPGTGAKLFPAPAIELDKRCHVVTSLGNAR
jgi:hypothetical protein